MRDLRLGDEGRRDRFRETFEHLLGLNLGVLETALDRAAVMLVDALDVNKIDLFAYEAASDSFTVVATGTTPMGRWRCASGIGRLPLVLDGSPTSPRVRAPALPGIVTARSRVARSTAHARSTRD